MSRVAKRPVDLPQGVTASVAANVVKVKGAKGELSLIVAKGVTVESQEKKLQIGFANPESRMTAGATRAHIANMVLGVSKGYERKLELVGVGYRAAVQGKTLNLQLGFSHDVPYAIPPGITIVTEKPTMISVSGIDKQLVGQVAAEIRSWRPPEPYKGKGVRYEGEYVRRKEGKKK